MPPTPIVLDHNFPEPIVQAVATFVPDLAFHPVRTLPGDLHELSDRELVYELRRRRCPVFVTLDHHMLDDVPVLVAIHETRITVVAIEDAGHDPIRGTGVLLRDLLDVIRRDHYRGEVYRIRPSRVRSKSATELLATLGDDPEQALEAFSVPFTERNEYPAGHELLLR